MQSKPTEKVSVALEVRPLAYFKSRDGATYLCAYIDEKRNREVFAQTEHGFLEVTDPAVKFIVARWTHELLEAARR